MLKKLMLGAAVSTIALSAALAQAPTAPKATDTPAATSKPMDNGAKATDKSTGSSMKSDANANNAAATGATSGTEAMASAPANAVVSSQQPSQWLASKFEGTDVVGTDDKKIGDVSDILFDKEGKIEAFVISIGGFLGVGSKEVALPPAAFDSTAGQNPSDVKLKLAMSKEELQAAAEFKRYQPPAPARPAGTTGQRSPASPPPASR